MRRFTRLRRWFRRLRSRIRTRIRERCKCCLKKECDPDKIVKQFNRRLERVSDMLEKVANFVGATIYTILSLSAALILWLLLLPFIIVSCLFVKLRLIKE